MVLLAMRMVADVTETHNVIPSLELKTCMTNKSLSFYSLLWLQKLWESHRILTKTEPCWRCNFFLTFYTEIWSDTRNYFRISTGVIYQIADKLVNIKNNYLIIIFQHFVVLFINALLHKIELQAVYSVVQIANPHHNTAMKASINIWLQY